MLRLIVLLFAAGPLTARADWKDDVGYTQLVNSLGVLGIPVPNGNGVPISLVESGGNAYWPDTNHADFSASSDPLGQATTFIDGTNAAAKTVGSHSTSMARTFFGLSLSVSPGANTVTVYEANNFLQQILHAPNGSLPATQSFRVQNFSWIGSFDDTPLDPPTAQQTADDVSTLRHFDYMINRDNLTAVVGLNNNTNPLPSLLGQSYNAIAVGKTNGVHSSGLTNLTNYGPGRSKPDLVVPQLSSSIFPTASAATASTSSAATLLHSVVAGTNAANSEVMKAMLMAGATKTEFPTWTRTASQPLDDTFGAGELNVFNSYLMTQGGRTQETPPRRRSWARTGGISNWHRQAWATKSNTNSWSPRAKRHPTFRFCSPGMSMWRAASRVNCWPTST